MVNITKPHIPQKYYLKDLILTTFNTRVDIRDLFIEMNIYEDIFSPTLSGHIILSEAVNLMEIAPIIGEETLEISFGSSNNGNFRIFTKTFHVYRVDNITLSNEKTKMYAVYFTSPEMMVNNITKIMRSYSGFSHKIVAEIYKKALKGDENRIVLEETKHTKNVIFPNWSPLRAIHYLCQTSLSKAHGTADLLFFENSRGYQFMSLTSLMNSGISQTINLENDNLAVLEYSMNRTATYNIDKAFDIIENTAAGMYGNKLITHDILNKKIETFDFGYTDNFARTKHLEPNASPLTHSRGNNPSAKILFTSKNYANEYVDEWLQNRKSKLKQIDNYITTIIMAGNTNQEAGNVINFEIPSTKSDDRRTLDQYLSGRFLISKIKHTLTRESYTSTYELRKDSFKKRT